MYAHQHYFKIKFSIIQHSGTNLAEQWTISQQLLVILTSSTRIEKIVGFVSIYFDLIYIYMYNNDLIKISPQLKFCVINHFYLQTC